jgi:hypothetical protein
MTALEPAVRPTAADVATLLGAGSSRRDRGVRFGRGLHRRPRGPHAPAPRAVGLAAALTVAVTITAAALPSSAPQPTVAADLPRPAVPAPGEGALPWTAASAVVPVDRVASSLGEGAEAARRRAAAVTNAFSFRNRPVARAVRTTVAPRPATDTRGRHRADDDDG